MALFTVFCLPLCAQHVYDMARFGIQPGKKSNMSTRMEKALAKIKKEVKEGETVTLRFQSGTYHFYPEGAAERTYYISNHDQDNPKKVGLALEDMKSLTIEGNGVIPSQKHRLYPAKFQYRFCQPTHRSGRNCKK